MSPIPSELIPKTLKPIWLIMDIIIKIIIMKNMFPVIKSMILIVLFDMPKHVKYERPNADKIINFLSLINMVLKSSIEIEIKINKSINVKNNTIAIIN